MIFLNIKTTDVLTIAGQRGTGKSTLLRMIARAAKKIIVYDPLFEHGMLGVPTGNVNDVRQLDRVVYQPLKNDEEEFEKFCKAAWEKDNVIVFVDECDEHADLYCLPTYFGRLVRLGRHKGIGVVAITRRIANLNKTVPALSQHIISFRQMLPNDISYLADFMGWKNASQLRDLPDYHYLDYDGRTGAIDVTKPDRQQPVQEIGKDREKKGKKIEGKTQDEMGEIQSKKKESVKDYKEATEKGFF